MLLLVETLTHVVKLPLGSVVVGLNRNDMELADRGGFEVRWAEDDTQALTQEEYRGIVKTHLQNVYKVQTGQEPPSITLNLASHQVMDDIVGWSKLNAVQLSQHDKL
jgi:hypothetical protein